MLNQDKLQNKNYLFDAAPRPAPVPIPTIVIINAAIAESTAPPLALLICTSVI